MFIPLIHTRILHSRYLQVIQKGIFLYDNQQTRLDHSLHSISLPRYFSPLRLLLFNQGIFSSPIYFLTFPQASKRCSQSKRMPQRR